MVGTTRRVERVLAAVATLAAFGVGPTAWAGETSFRSTDRALTVSLAREDLDILAQGLLDDALSGPILGHYDVPVIERFWFATIGIRGITYSFKIDALHIAPRDGHVHVDARLGRLQVNIERLTFNDSATRGCTNIPIASNNQAIPVSVDAEPSAQDRTFDLALRNTQISLDADNFVVGRPDRCDAIFGFDWVIRRILPWITSLVRDRIETGIAVAVQDAVREASGTLNDYMQLNITLPFKIEPAPAFSAMLSVWPSGFSVTPEHLQVLLGADIDLDADPLPVRLAERKSLLLRRALGAPSYLGIGQGLLEIALAEANATGLFAFSADAESLPVAAHLLTSESLRRVLPARDVPDGAVVALQLVGAQSVGVRLVPPATPSKPALVEMSLRGLALGIQVDGAAFYEAVADATLSMSFGYDPYAKQLRLALDSFQARALTGQYADGSVALPDQAGLDEQLEQLSGRLRDELAPILDVTVPELNIGRRSLELLGTGVRGDFVTLDAVVH